MKLCLSGIVALSLLTACGKQADPVKNPAPPVVPPAVVPVSKPPALRPISGRPEIAAKVDVQGRFSEIPTLRGVEELRKALKGPIGRSLSHWLAWEATVELSAPQPKVAGYIDYSDRLSVVSPDDEKCNGLIRITQKDNLLTLRIETAAREAVVADCEPFLGQIAFSGMKLKYQKAGVYNTLDLASPNFRMLGEIGELTLTIAPSIRLHFPRR